MSKMADLDYIVEVASSAEYGLFHPYLRICNLYQLYINSAQLRSRKHYLKGIHHEALEMAISIQALLCNFAFPDKEVRSIESALLPSLNSHYANFTHLYQLLILAKTKTLKFQYLTSLYYLLKDLAEIALLAQTEPEKQLEATGE